LSAQTRQILVWGTLWGIVVTAAEGVVIQDPDAGLGQALRFWLLQWLLPAWCAVGCLYLVVTRMAVRRGNGWPVVLGWLAVSLSWGILQPWINTVSNTWLGTTPNGTLGERMVYNLWPCLFFGGILVGAYALALRTERTRSLLQDAAIARSRTTALRGEAELADLQRHVDPDLLLDVMGDVERRYRNAPEQADDLLGRLVEFLRCAMPGLKDRTSTLAAELQLACAYVKLQSTRAVGRGEGAGWIIDEPADLPSLVFPSQLVLPMLALAAPGAEPRLRVRRPSGGVQIELHDLGRPVPEEFAQQARMSLQSLLGETFALHIDAERNPQLALTLGLAVPTGELHET
jgi:hypothetical protein